MRSSPRGERSWATRRGLPSSARRRPSMATWWAPSRTGRYAGRTTRQRCGGKLGGAASLPRSLEGLEHRARETRQVGIARAHDEDGVAGPRLADDPLARGLVVARIAALESLREIVRQHAARDVLRDGPAGVKDLGVAEAILRTEERRDERPELVAQEARRAEAVGLEDGDDARRARLRRGDGRAELLAIVRVVVHDQDVSRRRTEHLETARDAGEAREQGHHGVGVDPELERHQRGGGGVQEVVETRLRNVQRQVAAL